MQTADLRAALAAASRVATGPGASAGGGVATAGPLAARACRPILAVTILSVRKAESAVLAPSDPELGSVF